MPQDRRESAGELARRTAEEVLRDHLSQRDARDLEEDLRRNYDPDVVLMSAEGVHHGHDGVRKLARVLHRYVPEGQYKYHQLLAEGEIGMLVWSGHFGDGGAAVHDGVDSFVVRGGHITAQTIHFSSYDTARRIIPRE